MIDDDVEEIITELQSSKEQTKEEVRAEAFGLGQAFGYEDAIAFLEDELVSLREQTIEGGINKDFLKGVDYAIQMLFENLRGEL